MLGFLIFAVIGTPLVFKLYLFQQYIDFNINSYMNIYHKRPEKIYQSLIATIPIIFIALALYYTIIYSPTNILNSHCR